MTNKVVINYDDQPEEVAEKFLVAIQQLGLTVERNVSEGVPKMVFLISNELLTNKSDQSKETVAQEARRGFYGR